MNDCNFEQKLSYELKINKKIKENLIKSNNFVLFERKVISFVLTYGSFFIRNIIEFVFRIFN